MSSSPTTIYWDIKLVLPDSDEDNLGNNQYTNEASLVASPVPQSSSSARYFLEDYPEPEYSDPLDTTLSDITQLLSTFLL